LFSCIHNVSSYFIAINRFIWKKALIIAFVSTIIGRVHHFIIIENNNKLFESKYAMKIILILNKYINV